MGLPATKRHLIELLHKRKLSYEQIGEYSGISPERVKEIKKGEEPTNEEILRIRDVAYALTELRKKDTGEEND